MTVLPHPVPHRQREALRGMNPPPAGGKGNRQ